MSAQVEKYGGSVTQVGTGCGDSPWPGDSVGDFRVTFYDPEYGERVAAFNVEGVFGYEEVVSELADEHLEAGHRYFATAAFSDGSGGLYEVTPRTVPAFSVERIGSVG